MNSIENKIMMHHRPMIAIYKPEPYFYKYNYVNNYFCIKRNTTKQTLYIVQNVNKQIITTITPHNVMARADD